MSQKVLHTDQARVRANGIEIAYDTYGDAGAAPLLLITGLGGQLISWDEAFCIQLVARGYRVIRLDNRDAGLSTKFSDAGVPDIDHLNLALQRGETIQTPYALRDMAADALGLLDALKIESAHVLGSSMGGRIAQLMAIYHPHRVRTLTSIMSTMGEPGFPPPNPEALSVLLEPAPSDREAYIDSSVLSSRVTGGYRFSIDEARVRERAGQAFDRSFNPDGVTRQYAALMSAGSSKHELKSMTVPTLIIHGSEDPLISAEVAVDMANTIPEATLLIIEGMGHSVMDIPQIWPQIFDAFNRHAAES
jgi:pimeloyl-ACP methyl ester carboxylesterase